MTITANDNDLRECRNKKCSRMGVLIRTDRRYCSVCSAKLKWPSATTVDTPPIIDMLSEDELLDMVPTFVDFKGDWEAYGNYLRKWQLKAFEGKQTWEINEMLRTRKDARERARADARAAKSRGNGKIVVIGKPKGDDTFTCDADVKNCPIVAKQRIEMPHAMYNTWLYLCKRFDTEWLAYLKGVCEDGVWKITEMYFPKQRVQAAHVEAEDGEVLEGTIGSVHSHVSMGAFFSAEDESHFNHPVEIVINRAGDCKVALRVQLECGRYSRVEAAILLRGTSDETALGDALEQVMHEESYQTQMGFNVRDTRGHYYSHHDGYYSDGV
jgi:proteasome lid subunit RPN8/RPN11